MNTADQFFARAEALLARLERLVPDSTPPPLEDGVAWRWGRHNGVGRLKAIRHFNAVSVVGLQHIDFQRDELDAAGIDLRIDFGAGLAAVRAVASLQWH